MNSQADLKIEPLRAADIPAVLETFAEWHKTREQFEGYLTEQERGERTVFLAWLEGKVVGYVTILWLPRFEIFKEDNIPEIVDLNVITEYQRQGIGTALIRKCESECEYRELSAVTISVELTPEYEILTKMYPKLYYVPINDPQPGQLWHLIKPFNEYRLPIIALMALFKHNAADALYMTLRYNLVGNASSIKNYAELIQSGTLEPEIISQFLQSIVQKAENILRAGQALAYFKQNSI